MKEDPHDLSGSLIHLNVPQPLNSRRQVMSLDGAGAEIEAGLRAPNNEIGRIDITITSARNIDLVITTLLPTEVAAGTTINQGTATGITCHGVRGHLNAAVTTQAAVAIGTTTMTMMLKIVSVLARRPSNVILGNPVIRHSRDPPYHHGIETRPVGNTAAVITSHPTTATKVVTKNDMREILVRN
jgi:hypothetical protein